MLVLSAQKPPQPLVYFQKHITSGIILFPVVIRLSTGHSASRDNLDAAGPTNCQFQNFMKNRICLMASMSDEALIWAE